MVALSFAEVLRGSEAYYLQEGEPTTIIKGGVADNSGPTKNVSSLKIYIL